MGGCDAGVRVGWLVHTASSGLKLEKCNKVGMEFSFCFCD